MLFCNRVKSDAFPLVSSPAVTDYSRVLAQYFDHAELRFYFIPLVQDKGVEAAAELMSKIFGPGAEEYMPFSRHDDFLETFIGEMMKFYAATSAWLNAPTQSNAEAIHSLLLITQPFRSFKLWHLAKEKRLRDAFLPEDWPQFPSII